MKIQEILDTPNPDAKRFMLHEPVINGRLRLNKNNTSEHPLATEILSLDGVHEILIQSNWISITKSSESDWDSLLRAIAPKIREFEPGQLDKSGSDSLNSLDDQRDEEGPGDPRLELARMTLKQDIVPYLNSHGGSISLMGIEDDVLKIRYEGACNGCPASLMGTSMLIESHIKKNVDPDLEVEVI